MKSRVLFPWLVGLCACTMGAGEVERGMKPLSEKRFEGAMLARDFPPVFSDRNKKIAFGIACPHGADFAGTVAYSRWGEVELPARVGDNKVAVEGRADFFTYEPTVKGTVEWHVNFANGDVFAFYGGGLLAQDELQVLEHPALGSLRRVLLKEGLSTLVEEGGKATPILVQGVERRVKLATEPNAKEGRPAGLYGNAFARADAEAVRAAAVRIDPPTVSNIIAIEAPAHGRGKYTAKEIRHILQTAVTGFEAAATAAGKDMKEKPRVVIHTGFWGCGAYGGNRELMAILQLLAARVAKVNAVVFHAGDGAGVETLKHAENKLKEIMAETQETQAVIEKLEARGYSWGVGDGN